MYLVHAKQTEIVSASKLIKLNYITHTLQWHLKMFLQVYSQNSELHDDVTNKLSIQEMKLPYI